MGQLVFQATLGGAVNLIGPNIASTVNFTLPSADGSSGQTWTTNGSGVLSFGTLGIAGGGTGQTTANAAFNALAPSQTGNSGKYLTTDGTNTSWATNPLGTVTSVAATVPSFLSISGSPITTSGTLAFTLSGTALPTTSGGTGLTSFTSGGVVYASSTSALTSGSALTFDGTNLGITNGAGNAFLNIDAASASNSGFAFKRSGTTDGAIYYLGASQAMRFDVANAEQMRLTSTGLGIGTSSPSSKLEVRGSNNATNVRFGDSTGANALNIYNNTTSGVVDLGTSASAITFSNAGYEKMRLDSAGNLGLGVTPSASARPVIQVGAVGTVSNFVGTNTGLFGANYYYDGSLNKYISNGFAGFYAIGNSNGQHQWYIAPNNVSGAGATATFTQAMTLDASGNLGVGTTSPASRLHVSGVSSLAASSGSIAVNISGTTPSIAGGQGILQILSSDAAAVDAGGVLTFTANTTSLANYPMAAIAGKYQTAGAGVYGGYLQFITTSSGGTPTERARIDSSGNLLVGTTSLPALNRVKGFAAQSGSSGGIQIYQTANVSDWAVTSTSGNVVNFYSDTGSALTYAGSISVNGNVTIYGSVSDYRLKENVQPMQGALTKVLQLNPVTFAFKDSGQISQGFIAHELAEVVPDAVTGEKDAVDENGNPKYQGIDTSFLVATLTAALQELNAKFDAYVASHP